ncbi:MAG: hypothetical protein IT245_02315 [Bacteroidia bacterium]|nr:hypothetical protein [Bacteroidia bacterium]
MKTASINFVKPITNTEKPIHVSLVFRPKKRAKNSIKRSNSIIPIDIDIEILKSKNIQPSKNTNLFFNKKHYQTLLLICKSFHNFYKSLYTNFKRLSNKTSRIDTKIKCNNY